MNKEEYIALYNDPHMYDQWDIGPYHERSQFMLKYVHGTVLELGCGGSGFTRVLVNLGFKCKCVDVNPLWITLGRQRLPSVEYTHSMIEDYITDDRFDTVILMEVLEHVLNPVAVLGKARSLLAPQGRVLVSVPLRGGPWDHTDNHMRQYIAENLMLDARDAGFSIASEIWEEGQYIYGVLVE